MERPEPQGGDLRLDLLRVRGVLALTAESAPNAIAEALVVTPEAVEKHVSNIFGKSGLAFAG